MSNIVQFQEGGIPANTDDLIKGLQSVSAQLEGTAGGVPFMRLLKSGAYAYGPDNIEPEQGSRWAVNPYTVQHGFACWGDGELLGEVMVPFNQEPPSRTSLPDYGEPWAAQISLTMQCMNGEDKGISVLYRGTSKGLHNAVKKLFNAIITQAQHDKEHIVPLIALEVDSYHHKRYGEIFVPIFEIVEFLSFETGAAQEEKPETEPEPPKVVEAVGEGKVTGAQAGSEPVGSGRARTRQRRTIEAEPEAAAPGGARSRSRRRRRAS